MRLSQRVALGGGFALLCLLGISSVALLRSAPEAERRGNGEPEPATSRGVKPPEPRPEPEVKPVEETFAEELGEGPGEVFFVSRIREAVREGNPAFGRELLRQMKEQHPSSVLIYEAEEILKSSR